MNRILLAGDVDVLLGAWRTYLARSPVEVTLARSGGEMLQTAADIRPDLVILEQNIPTVDSVACCVIMRGMAALRGVPVLVAGSGMTSSEHQRLIRAGCAGFLTSPLDRRTFLTTVRGFIPAVEQREPRAPCRVPVQVDTLFESFTAMAEEISLGGMYLSTGTTSAASSDLYLRFRLPSEESPAPITVKGRVIWLNGESRDRKPAGVGVAFMNGPEHRACTPRRREISRFIAGALAAG